MRPTDERQKANIHFVKRALLVLAIWAVAGFISAAFADIGGIEAGDTEFSERAAIFYTFPICAAEGVTFAVTPWTHLSIDGPDVLRDSIFFVYLLGTIGLSLFILTRKAAKPFFLLILVHATLVAMGSAAFLYYYHWDTIHLHG
jgi:hypothetical protein